MSDTRNEETQQELFLEFSERPKAKERFPSIARPYKPILFTTSLEQIILAGIIIILLCCFMFFLGVLRGKSLLQKEMGLTVAGPSKPRIPQTVPAKAVPKSMPVVKAAVTQSRPSLKAPAVSLTPKPLATPDITKPYTIQLVTYKKRDLAEKDVAMLRKNGLYAFIIPSGDYFQVCEGQYATKEEAKKDLKLLSGRYKDCYLRRR